MKESVEKPSEDAAKEESATKPSEDAISKEVVIQEVGSVAVEGSAEKEVIEREETRELPCESEKVPVIPSESVTEVVSSESVTEVVPAVPVVPVIPAVPVEDTKMIEECVKDAVMVPTEMEVEEEKVVETPEKDSQKETEEVEMEKEETVIAVEQPTEKESESKEETARRAVEEPVKEKVLEEPVREKVLEEPVREKVLEEPVKEKVLEEPVKEKVLEEPVREKVLEEPVKEKILEEPMKEEVKEEPVKEVKEVKEEPTTEKMEEPATEKEMKELAKEEMETEKVTTKETAVTTEQPQENQAKPKPVVTTPERVIPVKKMLEMEKQLLLNEELKTLVSLLPDSDDTDESWSDETAKTPAPRGKAKETYKPVILGVYVDQPETTCTPPRASKKRDGVVNESPLVTPSKQVSVSAPLVTPVRPQPKEKAQEASPTKVVNECFVVGNCLPEMPAESSFFRQLEEKSDMYPVAVRRLLKDVGEERRRFDVLMQRQTSQFQAAYFMERSKWNAVRFSGCADW